VHVPRRPGRDGEAAAPRPREEAEHGLVVGVPVQGKTDQGEATAAHGGTAARKQRGVGGRIVDAVADQQEVVASAATQRQQTACACRRPKSTSNRFDPNSEHVPNVSI
jgi:hypothetical protein